ncbi:MAG: diacylglycerol/lipid kinase family protein [Rubrobacteraceae bacterium]|nr:diacylglycerol kinase family lipid kinase [Rubrobacter sp.]
MRRREKHVVFNPTANKGRAASRRTEISRSLAGSGEVIWHVTKERGHAARITSGLPEDALVVAAGGDGTVHEVAAACVGTGRTMGILPVGSGNDYVKALGVGGHLRRALEVLKAGKVWAVDAGEVNGIYFNNGLGIGFDAEVAAGVAEAPRYLGGFGGYLWSVGRLLWGFGCHEATLKLDGKRVEARTILVAAALGTTYGARFKLAPEARLDDGMFDVIWSDDINRAEVLRLIPAALNGTLLRNPKVHVARAREVEIEMAEEVPAHVDGEILSPTRIFRARALPGALRVVAP